MTLWRNKPHHWKQLRGIGREWCIRCGLVHLHNAATTWCVQHGCDSDEHPQYRAMIQQLTSEHRSAT